MKYIPYSKKDIKSISNSTFLITGGAGFIGSNIVKFLLENNAKFVKVIDDLSNGVFENVSKFIDRENFQFIEGDIRDQNLIENSLKGIDYVSHQAALGSVPRSIKNPIDSNSVNVDGFLNILNSIKNINKKIKLVYASSSSVYGDSNLSPKVEKITGNLLSPYAATKKINEMYADIFFKVWGINSVGLRYFNVFGPNQQPDNPYAAVIPLFSSALISGNPPVINGDKNISRDFTYVDNVVQANIKAMFCKKVKSHKVYNVGCGKSTSLIEIINQINKILNKKIIPKIGPYRKGDILHSLASIDSIKDDLGYIPTVPFEQGIMKTINWMLNDYE